MIASLEIVEISGSCVWWLSQRSSHSPLDH